MTSVLRGGVLELTAEQYLLAWRHLQLGLVHWNLQPRSVEQQCTVEESTAAQRRTWEALRARG